MGIELNGGSGFVEGFRDKVEKNSSEKHQPKRRGEFDNEVLGGLVHFFKATDSLLTADGIQLHDHVSDFGRVVPYPYYGSERFYYKQADAGLIANIKKNIVAVFYNDVGSMAFVKDSPKRINL